MRCPFCKEDTDKVIDSRSSQGGRAIRRRRECLACGRRFTTRERVDDTVKLQVIKKDGSRQPYDRNKILEGLQRACYKRPISVDAMMALTEDVEAEIFQNFDREVKSRFIGERVMRKLRHLDQVAYVRFASVYHEFKDIHDFIDEVEGVREEARDQVPGQRTLFDDQ
jgi:transcriptional repressor NrdR